MLGRGKIRRRGDWSDLMIDLGLVLCATITLGSLLGTYLLHP